MPQPTINTPRETTHQRIADALEDIVDKMVDTSSASNIDYDNTQSGLSANKVQGAVDELASEKVDKATGKGLSTNDYTNEEKQKNADNASAISDIQEDISQSLTATGNPLTIESSESNLVECTAEVEAVQDLHGYDYPWVGGAGKNKLPMTVDGIKALNTSGMWSGNVYTINGVTFTIQTDSDGNVTGIKANGTASSDSLFRLYLATNIFNTMKLCGCPSGGSSSTYHIAAQLNQDPWTTSYDNGSGTTITIENDVGIYIFIRIKSRYNANNILFKPMVSTDSSASYATFEPYSNISSITGQTEVVIEDVGKNLIDVPNKTISSPGFVIPQLTSLKLKAGNYVFSHDYSGSSSSVALIFYDENSNEIARGSRTNIIAGKNTSSVVLPSNCAYYNYYSNAVGTYSDFQLELGNTATPYEPYAGKTYTIQLGDAIYGGELDVLTGKMVVRKGSCKINELEWSTQSSDYANFKTSSKANEILKSDNQIVVISELYIARDNQSGVRNEMQIYSNASGEIKINDTRYSTTTDFINAVGNSVIVYELAEPYTIQLTPQQIRLLKGTNNISCNTGDLSIKYYPDNVLGQLKGDIEDEIDAVANRIKGVKTMQISGAAVSTDGSIMFTSLIGSIIVGTSISNDANSNKCVGIPYSMGSVPALKIMNESTMAVLPNITISGILYYIEL